MSTFSPKAVGDNILSKGFGVLSCDKEGHYVLTGPDNRLVCKVVVLWNDEWAELGVVADDYVEVSTWPEFWSAVKDLAAQEQRRWATVLELL